MSTRTPKLVPASEILVADEEAGYGAPSSEDIFEYDEDGKLVHRPLHSPEPDPETARRTKRALDAWLADNEDE